MTEERYMIGVDLGHSMDWTAVCVCEVERTEEDKMLLLVRHMERFIGKPYPEVVTEVHRLTLMRPLRGNSDLIIDATGVGQSVGHIFDERGISHRKVWIHGGENETYSDKERSYRVPKVELISNLAVLLHDHRFRMEDDLPLTEILSQELQTMQRKQNVNTGHQTFVHREGEHDDLVLAAALAAWGAKKFGGTPSHGMVGEEGPFAYHGAESPFSIDADFSW